MKQNTDSVLAWLLDQNSQSKFSNVDSISQWKNTWAERSGEWAHTIDRALVFGRMADRVAYAFVAGFRSALQHLIPDLDPRQFACFCITEEAGNSPRAIKTSLRFNAAPAEGKQGVLNGLKTFATGANQAEVIVVAAATGIQPSGRNQIKLIRLHRTEPGIEIEPMAPLSFIPEIEHGRVRFTNVRVTDDDVLPGDGYSDYIKPFRIIEEVHVMAAILGFLIRMARNFNWERALTERIIALITLVRALWKSDLSAADTHLAFAGFSQLLHTLITDTESSWDTVPKQMKESWMRDKAILEIARQARAKRLENAWAVLT